MYLENCAWDMFPEDGLILALISDTSNFFRVARVGDNIYHR